jgi:hypothetical protein
MQYIRSYRSYVEAVTSIRNLRAHHAVVTTGPNLTWPLLESQLLIAAVDRRLHCSVYIGAMMRSWLELVLQQTASSQPHN